LWSGDLRLETSTYLYLSFKQLGTEFDHQKIDVLIKEVENIEDELNLRIYELLEDDSYLKTAYKQVKEKAEAMENELSKKFLNYPIPKAIVEAWESIEK